MPSVGTVGTMLQHDLSIRCIVALTFCHHFLRLFWSKPSHDFVALIHHLLDVLFSLKVENVVYEVEKGDEIEGHILNREVRVVKSAVELMRKRGITPRLTL